MRTDWALTVFGMMVLATVSGCAGGAAGGPAEGSSTAGEDEAVAESASVDPRVSPLVGAWTVTSYQSKKDGSFADVQDLVGRVIEIKALAQPGFSIGSLPEPDRYPRVVDMAVDQDAAARCVLRQGGLSTVVEGQPTPTATQRRCETSTFEGNAFKKIATEESAAHVDTWKVKGTETLTVRLANPTTLEVTLSASYGDDAGKDYVIRAAKR